MLVVFNRKITYAIEKHNSKNDSSSLMLKDCLIYIDPWKSLGRASRYSRTQYKLE
jgi:hypothetical protein